MYLNEVNAKEHKIQYCSCHNPLDNRRPNLQLLIQFLCYITRITQRLIQSELLIGWQQYLSSQLIIRIVKTSEI